MSNRGDPGTFEKFDHLKVAVNPNPEPFWGSQVSIVVSIWRKVENLNIPAKSSEYCKIFLKKIWLMLKGKPKIKSNIARTVMQ